MEHAFEVEHTTAIYSGLLRMADLLALLPMLDIHLYIAAPDKKWERVREEIMRPAFLKMGRKPLYSVCSFLPYSAIEEINGMPNLEHMRDTIIEKYRVLFSGDEQILSEG
jgi:hypothetical protein